MIYHHKLNLSERTHWYSFHFSVQILVHWLRSPSLQPATLRPAFQPGVSSCFSKTEHLIRTTHTILDSRYIAQLPAIPSRQFSLRMSNSIKLLSYGYYINKHNLWIRFGICKMQRLNQRSNFSRIFDWMSRMLDWSCIQYKSVEFNRIPYRKNRKTF